MKLRLLAFLLLVLSPLASALTAQPLDLPYGAPISLERARKALAAAQTEAKKNKWNVAIAIVVVAEL